MGHLYTVSQTVGSVSKNVAQLACYSYNF